ncbi:MAG: exopolysaccharide biosynthesis protein [Pseudomonadota bacterium]
MLRALLDEAEEETVTLEWVIGHLRDRSFGIIMLLIAVIGLLPGLSPLAGVLMLFPALQMMKAHGGPVLPRRIAERQISKEKLARMIKRTVPVLRFMERFVRPRWRTPFEATKRVIGLVMLLLAATMLAPVPFSHVIPALVIILLAFAFLEEDGILLCIALLAALVSFAITATAVWGAVELGLTL